MSKPSTPFFLKALATLLCMVLCCVNMLLPINAGMPNIYIWSAPISVSALAVWIIFGLLIIVSKGENVRMLTRQAFSRYAFLYIAIASVISCLVGNVLHTLYWVFNIVTAFIINFNVMSSLVKLIGVRTVIIVFSIVISLAALVGLLEGLYHYQFDFYEHLNVLYWANREVYFVFRGTTFDDRIIGTMGNTIVFGTLIMISMPLVWLLRSESLKLAVTAMITVAGLLTLSRTVFIFLSLYGLCFLILKYQYVKKHLFHAVLASFALIIVALNLPVFGTIGERWAARISEERSMGDSEGVTARYIIAKSVLTFMVEDDPIKLLIGRGFGSSASEAHDMSEGLATFDNAYITVIYENGLGGVLMIASSVYVLIRRRKMFLYEPLCLAAIASYFLCGFSFVIHVYSTINFVLVLIVVISAACAVERGAVKPA